MQTLKYKFNKENIFLVQGGLFVLFFVFTRLFNSSQFPIFTDEAMMIHMAQNVAQDPSAFFLFRMEGKHPLFMWINALLFPFFNDPLMAGRMVSVLTGLATLVGIYKSASLLFSKRVGLLSALFWLLSPYALFYERLAQVESLFTALGIWAFYICIKITRRDRSGKGFAGLGVLLAFGFYTKATAVLLFPLPLITFLLTACHKREGFWKHIFLMYGITLVLIIPLFAFGKEIGFFARTGLWQLPTYFLSVDKLLTFPWEHWWANMLIAGEFIVTYLTFPLFVVAIFSCVRGLVIRDKNLIAVTLWALVPFFLIMLVANGFYSRYFLFIMPPIIILVATGTERLLDFITSTINKRQGQNLTKANGLGIFVTSIFLIILVFDNVHLGWKLIDDPLKAPIHSLDRMLHLEGANSGYGIREAAQFLIKEARDGQVTLMVPMKPGNSPEGISVYLWGNEKVRQIPVPWWPGSERLIPDKRFPVYHSIYRREAREWADPSELDQVYFVYPFTQYPRERFLKVNPKFKKVWTFLKPDKKHAVEIYKRM